MAASVLYVDFRWEQIDPDGSPCYCCGEAMYLWSWRLRVLINGEPSGGFTGDVVVCGSCFDLVGD